MQVFRHLPPPRPHDLALTIGNFDGVHLGHQAMLARLLHAARSRGVPAAVMTFEPHPREFFAPADAPPRITSLREKVALLREHGIDELYVMRFDERFAAQAAQAFIDDALHKALRVKWLLVGDDFRFGAKRAGDYALLAANQARVGYALEAMDSVSVNGARVSSTLIRDALAAGRLGLAAEYLGRPYSIEGRVAHGDKIGRTLGFPTANVMLKRARPPVKGVFTVKFRVRHGRVMNGVASVGTRPAVTHAGRYTLEVFVLDFDGDLYGRHVSVEFLARLRDEAHYPSLEALTAQIARDVSEAKRYFAKA